MTFEHSIKIDATPKELFYLTQDYSRRLEWDSFLKAAELIGDPSKLSVGSRAICTAKSGLVMETEYVSFNPPHTTAVKMTEGPWFIASFAGSWRFEELDRGKTKVTFRYHVKARPKWMTALLSPILGYIFSRDTKRRLIALREAVEVGGILKNKVA
jgi:ribosome-associated toxin RatA of RatAB toxin-antitoxin module